MKRNSESGQALVFAAVGLVALLGFVGLGVDMGMLRYERRLQQSAADASAIAEIKELSYGGVNTIAAQNAVSGNGFSGANVMFNQVCPTTVTQLTVTVNNPPLSGPHNGDTKYVESCVAALQPTYFMRIFGVNNQVVNSRAVATQFSGNGNGTGAGCLYTLGAPAKKLTWQDAGVGGVGAINLHAPTCGIMDNGNLVANGGKNLNITAGSIGVGGTYEGPSVENCAAGVGVCPQPCADGQVCGMPYSGNPFNNTYPAPSVGAVIGSLSANSGAVTTFNPGTYTGGTINAGAQVVFTPGEYVVDGGTFRINGGAEVCGGGTVADWSAAAWTNPTTPACTYSGGVTFYVTNNATVISNGTATIQMYAPNSGTYEGLLFFQDPADTNDMTLTGTSNSIYQGAIYAPTANLIFGGTGYFNSLAKYTVIVVDQLLLNGTPDVYLNSDYSGLANGGGPLLGALAKAVLVE